MVSQAHSVYLIPDAYWGFIELLAGALHNSINPGISIVDANVQLAVLFPLDALEEALDIIVLGMIHDNCNSIMSSSVLDLVASLLKVRGLPASNVHSGAGLSKLQGNAATDTAAGTSHKGDATSKGRGHFNEKKEEVR